jgi:hypothetical protein
LGDLAREAWPLKALGFFAKITKSRPFVPGLGQGKFGVFLVTTFRATRVWVGFLDDWPQEGVYYATIDETGYFLGLTIRPKFVWG